jgi:large subunit ribosomal protein L24
MPIHYSNVMLVDRNGRPTRVSIRRVERDGKIVRVRIAKTTGEEIP